MTTLLARSARITLPTRHLLAARLPATAVRRCFSDQTAPDDSASKVENSAENLKLPPKQKERKTYPLPKIELPFMKEDLVFDGQTNLTAPEPLTDLDTLPRRHIGPDPNEIKQMLDTIGVKSMEEFIHSVVPEQIRSGQDLKVSQKYGLSETLWQTRFKEIIASITTTYSFVGQGYYGTKVPEVIKRNILECPEWYTSYTPYQAEISQGRLESLINFQTMVTSLTGLQIANASVLDELTAAAEAMTFAYACLSASRQKSTNKVFLVSNKMFPQTIDGLYPRAEGFNIKIVVADLETANLDELIGDGDMIGAMVQYPDIDSNTGKWLPSFTEDIHARGGIVCCGTDLLALTMLKPPGEWGADVAFGSAQRFGVPMGLGGPHAGFFATSDRHKRKLPGRLIGASKDRLGDKAYRLALQTREQHIRREKATSNICTAQALLANMSAMYAVYHGPSGLKKIAQKVVATRQVFAQALLDIGWPQELVKESDFDTVHVGFSDPKTWKKMQTPSYMYAGELRSHKDGDEHWISVSFDETTDWQRLSKLIQLFNHIGPTKRDIAATQIGDEAEAGDEATKAAGEKKKNVYLLDQHSHSIARTATEKVLGTGNMGQVRADFARESKFLEQPVFNKYHSETEMLRYIHHLQSKDLSLANTMIPLGSCTMKLNATSEMIGLSFQKLGNLHPLTPARKLGYFPDMVKNLEKDLCVITGFDACSIQPNSGAQGEFTGLRMIRNYLKSIGQGQRDTLLIPVSAHGTNPASATMVGFKVQPVKCDTKTGNLDLEDLKAKAEKLGDKLAGAMITYPSTFGVFEPGVKDAIQIVHDNGGQVYMDGANMNAQIGITSPGYLGADVCHLNLHKTFCIPHGGGGPGVGPVCVAKHLEPFLPSHANSSNETLRPSATSSIGPVSSAQYGSASILPISYSYIKMMGAVGLKHATEICLLNANYMAKRLSEHYDILYTNENGRCAHEFILDPRPLKETSGVEAVDIAKRLMDYGFHAPTMSWPVPGTLMIEPTESESKEEMDRYCDALIEIRNEIREIEEGKMRKDVNVLKMAPHPMQDLLQGEEVWKDRGYTREKAGYPLEYLRERKFWPSVARVDDAFGDTNLFCTCDPMPQEGDAPAEH
ncbi:glycine decarboxylase subunit P [Orbilia oligospora]|uniref:glycine dehydrogenase (aminomethyl-transferring) n=1 Tax=Orbilia oligospora TaxID=2813651 RepID=A0A7C8K751_ORBOL|nr:glycine decarboxylase subunit P [Orbilia oligospora]TGJ69657.1 glycine decarboxylase subunit P [Orbilia oligospora]